MLAWSSGSLRFGLAVVPLVLASGLLGLEAAPRKVARLVGAMAVALAVPLGVYLVSGGLQRALPVRPAAAARLHVLAEAFDRAAAEAGPRDWIALDLERRTNAGVEVFLGDRAPGRRTGVVAVDPATPVGRFPRPAVLPMADGFPKGGQVILVTDRILDGVIYTGRQARLEGRRAGDLPPGAVDHGRRRRGRPVRPALRPDGRGSSGSAGCPPRPAGATGADRPADGREPRPWLRGPPLVRSPPHAHRTRAASVPATTTGGKVPHAYGHAVDVRDVSDGSRRGGLSACGDKGGSGGGGGASSPVGAWQFDVDELVKAVGRADARSPAEDDERQHDQGHAGDDGEDGRRGGVQGGRKRRR